MSNVDKDIIDTFANVREFCKQAALLLRTADGIMQRYGYTSVSKNTTFADTSASLEWPKYWIPYYMSRGYIHTGSAQVFPFVGIILGHPSQPEIAKEALVSAGWIDFGSKTPKKSWKPRYVRAHLFATNRKDDGTLCFGDLSRTWKKDLGERGAKQLATFAFPLSGISNGADFEKKVMDRLMAELRGSQSIKHTP